MNSQRDIFSLTIAAFLNAILLSFLSIQLLVPFAFIIMMVLNPVLILLKTYYVNRSTLWLSLLLVLIITLVFFGVGIFIWGIFYITVGLIAGYLWKKRTGKRLRQVILALTYSVSFGLLIFALIGVAQVQFEPLLLLYNDLGKLGINFSVGVLAAGFLSWATCIALMLDHLADKVLKQKGFMRRWDEI